MTGETPGVRGINSWEVRGARRRAACREECGDGGLEERVSRKLCVSEYANVAGYVEHCYR